MKRILINSSKYSLSAFYTFYLAQCIEDEVEITLCLEEKAFEFLQYFQTKINLVKKKEMDQVWSSLWDEAIDFDRSESFLLKSMLKRIPSRVSCFQEKKSFFASSNMDYSPLVSEVDNQRAWFAQFNLKEIETLSLKDQSSRGGGSSDQVFLVLPRGGRPPFWSPRNFARLAKKLHQKKSELQIFLLYQEDDQKLLEEFYLEYPDFLKQKGEEFILSDSSLFSQFSERSFVVGSRTIYTQAFSLLGSQCIEVNNPLRENSLLRWPSLSKDSFYFSPPVICGEDKKCLEDTCLYFNCMGKIEVNQILEKIIRESK